MAPRTWYMVLLMPSPGSAKEVEVLILDGLVAEAISLLSKSEVKQV